MNWIDLSDLKKPSALPEGWDFKTVKEHMDDEETAKCGDDLLLTMFSDKIGKGEIVAVRDHVNLSGKNPLRGHNKDDLGVRFPDMSHPYAVPDNFNGRNIIIRAGQNTEHPFDAIDASEIVYQTILAKHQLKKVFALIYGEDVEPEKIIEILTGE